LVSINESRTIAGDKRRIELNGHRAKENLEVVEINISPKVLVVGSGPVAHLATLELAKMGYQVLLCSQAASITGHDHLWGSQEGPLAQIGSLLEDIRKDPSIEIMAATEILEFQGSPGNFWVTFRGNDEAKIHKEVGAVMLSNEPFPVADFSSWGVNESERIKNLSWVESMLSSSDDDLLLSSDSAGKVVFLCGFTHHSNPFSQKRALEAAMRLVSEGTHTVIFLVDQFQVAGYGLERLTHRARESGVLFVKLTGIRPEIERGRNKVTVSYYDQELEEKVTIFPDFLILEEAYKPPREMMDMAGRLGVTADRSGFLQDENIYNQPIYTNRHGVWVVDSAKGPASFREGIEEAKAAAMDIHQFLGKGGTIAAERRLLFDEAKCGKCLTCYRSCPHLAISYYEVRPVFHDLACKACGICAGACPMDAIQIAHFTDHEIIGEIENAAHTRPGQTEGDSLYLVAFCCENSAFDSARMASLTGLPLPKGLQIVRVPCAGRVDLQYLLKALESGADGVMIIGCHDESCTSVRGNRVAKNRIQIIGELLGDVGLEKERLFFESCAPGMGREFSEIATRAEGVLRDLGKVV
jgi:heterodisulfide reductase subunit A-like polyferredoxin/coenzyme F420-reducing hydrogenase delta subunit